MVSVKDHMPMGHLPNAICHIKTKVLVLLLCFLASGLLLFSFFLSRFFFSDGFLALVGGRSSLLCRFDQLLCGFNITSKWGLLFLWERSHQLLELLKSGNCFRDRVRLAEVRDAELIVRLSHLRVVLDGFLERIRS